MMSAIHPIDAYAKDWRAAVRPTLMLLCAVVLTGCGTGFHANRSAEQKQAISQAWTGTPSELPRWRKGDSHAIRHISQRSGASPSKQAGNSGTAKPAPQTVEATDRTIQLLIKEAQSYLGTPYAWGGMSRKGLDCSGYMVLVFRKVGIELPRVSPDQYAYGRKLGRKQIQPGDLMFFYNYKPGVIGHTALCVSVSDGVPRFIHASSSGVRYDDLNNSYWGPRYMGACRVLDAKEQARR